MADDETDRARRIVPVAEAAMLEEVAGESHLKQAVTRLRLPETGAASFTITSDEPAAVGGGDEHPSPIMYLAGAVATCLLTQITRVARARSIPVEDARVAAELEMRQQGSFARGDARSWSEEVRVTVELVTDAAAEEIDALIAMARRTCFVEASLGEAVPIRHTLRVNGRVRE